MDRTHIAYRPSNGTEGEYFEAKFCGKCERERAFRESHGEKGGCSIHAHVFALSIDDKDYPKEWRQDGPEGPRCDAFRVEGTPSQKRIDRDRARYEAAIAEMRAERERLRSTHLNTGGSHE